MKQLFLISLLIISNVSLAGAFRSKNQLLTGDTTFRLKSACEAHYLEPCIDVRGYDLGPWSIIVPDTYLKEQVDACADDADCQTKLESLSCTGEGFYPIKRLDILEVYCTKFVPEHIGIDQAVKTAYEAQKAAEEAEQAAISQMTMRMSNGAKVVAKLNVLVAMKTPEASVSEVTEITTRFAAIASLLRNGGLESAKAAIQSADLSGTILTESDRAELISYLDGFL